MEHKILSVITRSADSKADDLRAEGMIPAVVYGGGRNASTSVTVHRGEFLKLRKTISESTVFDVDVDGDRVPVLMGQIQYDPITDEPIHVDFRQLDMSKPVTAHIRLNYVGESPAVKAGGMLVVNRESVLVKAIPSALIDSFDVDVSSLKEFDQSLHVSDLLLADGIEVMENDRTALVVVHPPRTAETFTDVASEAEAVAKVEVAGKEEKEGDEKEEGAKNEK